MAGPMQLVAPNTGILAFYDGREGKREHDQPNWLDDGALMMGIASYAIIDGGEALVYDAHRPVDRARWIRKQLNAARITVVHNHRHIDDIAGTEAFGDCEVLAGPLTAKLLGEQREAIEAATPPVKTSTLETFAQTSAWANLSPSSSDLSHVVRNVPGHVG